MVVVFFFFKQKTAYEMRISDWSSDVCSSDLIATDSSEVVRELAIAGAGIALRSIWDVDAELADGRLVRVLPDWRGSDDAAVYALHLPDALPRAGDRKSVV